MLQESEIAEKPVMRGALLRILQDRERSKRWNRGRVWHFRSEFENAFNELAFSKKMLPGLSLGYLYMVYGNPCALTQASNPTGMCFASIR